MTAALDHCRASQQLVQVQDHLRHVDHVLGLLTAEKARLLRQESELQERVRQTARPAECHGGA